MRRWPGRRAPHCGDLYARDEIIVSPLAVRVRVRVTRTSEPQPEK